MLFHKMSTLSSVNSIPRLLGPGGDLSVSFTNLLKFSKKKE